MKLSALAVAVLVGLAFALPAEAAERQATAAQFDAAGLKEKDAEQEQARERAIQQVRDWLRRLPEPPVVAEIIRLKGVKATEIAALLATLYRRDPAVKVIALPRLNYLLVVGEMTKVREVRLLVYPACQQCR